MKAIQQYITRLIVYTAAVTIRIGATTPPSHAAIDAITMWNTITKATAEENIAEGNDAP